MPVVSECKCVGGCYRLPHYQQFTVPAHSQEERGSGVAGQSQMEGHQRMVNVGRCAGSCPEPEPECIRSVETLPSFLPPSRVETVLLLYSSFDALAPASSFLSQASTHSLVLLYFTHPLLSAPLPSSPLRSRVNPDECQLMLTPVEQTCSPVAMEPVDILTARNHTQTAWRVTQCGCGH